MFGKTSLRLSAILLTTAAALLAHDVTGKWNGTVYFGKQTVGIAFDLHQTGSHITGTVATDKSTPLQGDIDGDQVRLDATGSNGERVHFELALNGTELRGSGWELTASGGKRDEATVVLNLAQPSASAIGVNGTWTAVAEMDDKTDREVFTLHLNRNGSEISGDMTDRNGKSFNFTTGTINGNVVVLILNVDDVNVRFELTLAGNALTGTATATHQKETRIAKVTAVKQA